MNNEQGKSMAIAVLCVTAVIMLCSLLILQHLPVRQAEATGPVDRQGDYIMVPGASIRGNIEAVFIVDIAAQRAVAYEARVGRDRIELVAGYDLKRLP